MSKKTAIEAAIKLIEERTKDWKALPPPGAVETVEDSQHYTWGVHDGLREALSLLKEGGTDGHEEFIRKAIEEGEYNDPQPADSESGPDLSKPAEIVVPQICRLIEEDSEGGIIEVAQESEPDKGDGGDGARERPVIAEMCTEDDGFMKISPDDTLKWVHQIAEKYCGVSPIDSRPRELYIEEALVERDRLQQEADRLQKRLKECNEGYRRVFRDCSDLTVRAEKAEAELEEVKRDRDKLKWAIGRWKKEEIMRDEIEDSQAKRVKKAEADLEFVTKLNEQLANNGDELRKAEAKLEELEKSRDSWMEKANIAHKNVAALREQRNIYRASSEWFDVLVKQREEIQKTVGEITWQEIASTVKYPPLRRAIKRLLEVVGWDDEQLKRMKG